VASRRIICWVDRALRSRISMNCPPILGL
jgi:hypothetical protein